MNKIDVQIKDKLAKKYFGNNYIFSDLFNYYFNGKLNIDPITLKDSNTEQINIIKKHPLYTSLNRRDILKSINYKENDDGRYLLLGIEVQSSIDPIMVLRNLRYDIDTLFIQYDEYYKNIHYKKIINKIKKEGILSPLYTLVIYLNDDEWVAPLDIKSLFYKEFRDKTFGYENYKINLISPYNLDDEELKKFKSSVKYTLGFIKRKNDKKELIEYLKNNSEHFSKDNGDEDLLLLAISDIKIEKNGEWNGMCLAFEEYGRENREQGRIEGIEKTKIEMIRLMYKNGADINTISKLLSLDIDYVKNIIFSN